MVLSHQFWSLFVPSRPPRTFSTTPEDVFKAKAAGIPAYKLYPAGMESNLMVRKVWDMAAVHQFLTSSATGATTNSDSGVTDINKVVPTLK